MSEAPQPALEIRDLSVDIATDEGSAQILDRGWFPPDAYKRASG